MFDLENDGAVDDVSTAPPVPDMAASKGQAMQDALRVVTRKPSVLLRWFLGLAVAVIGAMALVATWDFINGLLERAPILGWLVTGLVVALLLVMLFIALRELAAINRLSRVDELRHASGAALVDEDLFRARIVVDHLIAFYRGREETRWGRTRLSERKNEEFDVATLFGLAEKEILASLDAAACREVEIAARQVAIVTALVPLALVDVVTALASSLRMIRRIAEIYGGRSGFLGSWRLIRAVFIHLAATGAIALGDDLFESILGGSVLSRLSRRFGEGLANGVLTARVGIAAMEVCRPLPFSAGFKPSTRNIIMAALGGLFSGK